MLLLIRKQETVLKKLTEKGVYRQTDYLSFVVTQQQQELLISQIKIQYQNEFSTLSYLSGIQDTVAVPLAKPEVAARIANLATVELRSALQLARDIGQIVGRWDAANYGVPSS